jgi:hypothetical protein
VEFLESRIAPAFSFQASINPNPLAFAEGDTGRNEHSFTLTITREPITEPITIEYYTEDGTAHAGEDYVSIAPTSVTFAAGETVKRLSVTFIGDTKEESDETFFLPYTAGIFTGKLPVTIANDDSAVVVAPTGKRATFLDSDGDEVTIKTTKGALKPENLIFNADGSLRAIDLLGDSEFNGANLTITAEQVGTGNGRVDVGLINAIDLDLGSATIDGTLGRITVGDGDDKKSALKSLSVGSLGTTDPVTQPLLSEFRGDLGKLNITSDVRGAAVSVQGELKKVTVGGDLVGDTGNGATLLAALLNDQSIVVTAGTGGISVGAFRAGSAGSFNVKGSMNGGSIGVDGDIGSINVGNDFNGAAIAAGGQLDVVKVFGKLKSDDPNQPAVIAALARLGSSKAAGSVAIDRLEVRGDVENAQILLGYKKVELNGTTQYQAKNPDASSGRVLIGGDWVATSLVAGVFDATADGFGRNDQLIAGDETDRIVAQIASVVIKGNAIGSTRAGDHFGIVAQEVGKLTIAGETIPLSKDDKDNILLDETNGDFRIVEM